MCKRARFFFSTKEDTLNSPQKLLRVWAGSIKKEVLP
jgi:hypothetical protein